MANILEESALQILKSQGIMPEPHGGQVCVIHKMEHENCAGCSSEMACGKLVRLMLVLLLPASYPHRDFEEWQKMEARVQELLSQVMEAKTPEDLKAIPFA